MLANPVVDSRGTGPRSAKLVGDRPDTRGGTRAMAAEPRFLTLADVAEVLNISTSQAYALVRNNELKAIKVGGRGQWRVERDRLEDYIAQMYEQTSEFIAKHPFVEADEGSD
jgi:excisionase family DNA binding protein